VPPKGKPGMSEIYGSHSDYMKRCAPEAQERQVLVEKELREAFSAFIEARTVEVILFENVTVPDLAAAIMSHPLVLKPLIAACNIAARAIERDIEVKNLSTYAPKLNERQAAAVAGYLKPFLPAYLEIPTLSHLDRVEFIDKEIRKNKGRWEHSVLATLNHYGKAPFKKRKFEVHGEEFELDAASPTEGPVQIGIDVKRIEARRDIHKRCDEIVNKAAKLKSSLPTAKFAAVIYYPFITEHINVQNRLESANIDAVSFAAESEESVDSAVRMLLAQLDFAR